MGPILLMFDFFLTDIGGLSAMKGSGIKFDKSNSYYNYIKSFPNIRN